MSAALIKVAGLVGLGVVGTGGLGTWYFTSSSGLVAVNQDGNDYKEVSLGGKYGAYFLSANHNKQVWERRYEKYRESFYQPHNLNADRRVQDAFFRVNSAFSATAEKNWIIGDALNQICARAYKVIVDRSYLKPEWYKLRDHVAYIERNLWRFCGLGGDIKTVKENGDKYSVAVDYPGRTPIGSENSGSGFADDLVTANPSDSTSNWFWDLKTKEFWSDSTIISEKGYKHNVFGKLKADPNRKGENIKATCAESYKRSQAWDNITDAIRFCSARFEIGS